MCVISSLTLKISIVPSSLRELAGPSVPSVCATGVPSSASAVTSIFESVLLVSLNVSFDVLKYSIVLFGLASFCSSICAKISSIVKMFFSSA